MEPAGDRGAYSPTSQLYGGQYDARPDVGATAVLDERRLRVALLNGDGSLIDSLAAPLAAASIELVCDDDNAGGGNDAPIASVDAMIIDTGPGWDHALATASRIRALSLIGIVVLAEQLQPDARVPALSLGVDHVLAKPVDAAELVAILRNLARFSDRMQLGRRKGDDEDTWALDHERWRLVAPAGESIELLPSEYAVLSELMATPGVQHMREDLLCLFRMRRGARHTRSLDVLVSKLRTKIEQRTGRTFPLRAVRGVGYVFVGPDIHPTTSSPAEAG